jgi:CPA2 family monovalent cation:H+ antiporter-2
VLGLVRSARSLGQSLAQVALPEEKEGRTDLAAAPRRMLVVTLQLAAVLTVGLLLLAVTQPFVRPIYGAAVLALLLVALGFSFWRTATDLQGHVRAGVHVVIEALARHAPSPALAQGPRRRSDDTLEDVRTMLPGMGEPFAVEVPVGSRTIGLTLRQIDLRGRTGASVLAIRRGNQALVPTGREAIEAGDVLAVMGTHEAVDAARELVEELEAG